MNIIEQLRTSRGNLETGKQRLHRLEFRGTILSIALYADPRLESKRLGNGD